MAAAAAIGFAAAISTPVTSDVGRVRNKVALVTGAARGQGRAEAVLLAAEGADVIAIDVCAALPLVSYASATPDDLARTVALVEATGRRCIPAIVDVRDYEALAKATEVAMTSLGRLDIVVANAGISAWGRVWELSTEDWNTMIDVNLTGVWHTLRTTIPTMIEHGNGGSIILTSSVAGLKALPGQAHYVAAKHGLVGLTRAAAVELGPYNIRVNSIHPWGVDTEMNGRGPALEKLLDENPTYRISYSAALAYPRVASPEDIAQTVLYLSSDESRCVTGAQIEVDMGATKM
jgi:SDR family mycofactocin-dependent oxidoreductase